MTTYDQETQDSCPHCGSVLVTTQPVTIDVEVRFVATRSIATSEYACAACGEAGDFDGRQQEIIDKTLYQMELDFIQSIVERNGIRSSSLATIERILGLRLGTIRKIAKPSKPSPLPHEPLTIIVNLIAAILRMVIAHPIVLSENRSLDDHILTDAFFGGLK